MRGSNLPTRIKAVPHEDGEGRVLYEMGVRSGQRIFVAFLRMGGQMDGWGLPRMETFSWVEILYLEGQMFILGDRESPLFRRAQRPSPSTWWF